MTWIFDVLSALRLPPRILAGMAFPAGFLVLSPNPWLEQLGLWELIDQYRSYISLVFLVASSVLLIEWVCSAYAALKSRRDRSRFLKALDGRIDNLDLKELSVLREFAIQNQSTILLPLNQPVVAGLVKNGILRQVGEMGQHMASGVVFSFKINDYLTERVTAEFLGLQANPTPAEIDKIKNARPPFVLAVLSEDRLFNSPRF